MEQTGLRTVSPLWNTYPESAVLVRTYMRHLPPDFRLEHPALCQCVRSLRLTCWGLMTMLRLMGRTHSPTLNQEVEWLVHALELLGMDIEKAIVGVREAVEVSYIYQALVRIRREEDRYYELLNWSMIHHDPRLPFYEFAWTILYPMKEWILSLLDEVAHVHFRRY